MTEQEARQLIADEIVSDICEDLSLPQALRDSYLLLAQSTVNGSNQSFACLQRIEFLMTGVCRPLLPPW